LVILIVLPILVAPVTPKTMLPNARLMGETISPAADAGVAPAAIIPNSTTKTSPKTSRLDEAVRPQRL